MSETHEPAHVPLTDPAAPPAPGPDNPRPLDQARTYDANLSLIRRRLADENRTKPKRRGKFI
jgi:hypothetical protein